MPKNNLLLGAIKLVDGSRFVQNTQLKSTDKYDSGRGEEHTLKQANMKMPQGNKRNALYL